MRKEVRDMTQAYCVRCKTQKEIKDETTVTTKNNRKALKGTCPDCGAGMYKFIKG